MTRKINHLHTYERIKLGKDKKFIVFRCTDIGCSHYVRKEMARGKICKCYKCGEPMILDYAAMQRKKVHCVTCTESPKKEKINKLAELMEKLG